MFITNRTRSRWLATPRTPESASDHTTALSPSSKTRRRSILRGKCIRIVGLPLRPHLSLDSLADDQPELGFTRRRPQTPRRSTHKAHPTRALREAPTRFPYRGAPFAGTNTSSATASRRVATSFLSASTSGKSTASTSTVRSLSFLHHIVVGRSVVGVHGQHGVQRVFQLKHSSVLVPSAIFENHIILDILMLFR